MLHLLHMLEKRTEYLDCDGQIDAVYTDFEKAFEKVPHKILLSKLRSYGISGNIINWIKDFLAGRKYRVKVNGSYSSWVDFTSGIALCPQLFLICINDLIDCCEPFSHIYLFADDAKIFHHVLHPGDQQILQKGINKLVEWTQRWILNLNTKKCLVVSFGRDVNDNKDSVYTIPHKELS